MADNKPYAPTYRDELAVSRHFVDVLEQKLAGRDAVRRSNVHPLDWCHLGVLGPAKVTPVPVEFDAAQVEAEVVAEPATADAAAVVKGLETPVAPTPTSAETAPAAAGAAGFSPASELDKKSPPEEPPVVVDKGDDREGRRRPPSALGFEILVQPDDDGFIELTVDASFCVFTKHLPTFKEQTSVLDAGPSAGAPLADVVQRWPLEVKGVTFRFPTNKSEAYLDDGIVQKALEEAVKKAFDKPDAERLWPGTRPKVEMAEYLKSESSFAKFLDSLITGLSPERWEMNASLEVRATPRDDGKVRVGCYFRNDTPESPPLTKGKGLKDAFKVISDVCINAVLQKGELHPVEILPVPQDYQYDRRVWAVGHNTSVLALGLFHR